MIVGGRTAAADVRQHPVWARGTPVLRRKRIGMTTLAASTKPARERRSFADLSVNVKVLSAVSIAAVVALFVGVNGIRSLSDASDSAQQLYANNVLSVRAVGDRSE